MSLPSHNRYLKYSTILVILVPICSSFPDRLPQDTEKNNNFLIKEQSDSESITFVDGVNLDDNTDNTTPLDIENETTESTTTYSIDDDIVGFGASNLTDNHVNNISSECQCGQKSIAQGLGSLAGFIDDKGKSRQISELIVGGNSTFRGEFPWMAALLKTNPYASTLGPRVICGATLINSNYLITAAHCIHRQIKERLSIVFNAHKITTATDVRRDPEVLAVSIKRLIPHANFNSKTVDNDIGLIELAEPLDLVKLKNRIRPICLPQNPKETYAKRVATVVGWGYTRPAAGVSSPELLQAEVPILSEENCLKTGYGTKILKSMLCAGYDEGGVDACTNDSGGPLTVAEGDTNVLVGVVSWGHSCAKPKLPGVYSRVANYLDWIRQHARKGLYCTDSTNSTESENKIKWGTSDAFELEKITPRTRAA